jgi:UDP-glucose 4-epimerase
MAKADDLGEYYRIPADDRDLNYENYFSEGEIKVAKVDEYHSHNTEQLDIEGVKQLLLKLSSVRADLKIAELVNE